MCRSSALHSNLPLILVPLILLAFLPSAYAFGAGSIPDYSYLKDVAFRHGDIESVIEQLSKVPTGGHGGGLLGVAGGIAGAIFGKQDQGGFNVGDVLKAGATAVASGGKFSGLDVKRIYLGNFLRDYSQACDIAGLSKLNIDSIVLVVTVLSFMVFGYASDEFEITKEKLGVYLPVEHIDNPKGYAADQPNGDARPYDSRLRGPVLDEELEIDPNNGMKKYIATQSDRFDNSAACIRRTLQKCIELGRRTRDQPDSLDRYEAYRLLGTALHTGEDLMAHSNWMEIALGKLGYRDVFTHVGDNVKVRAPNGEEVAPLVTGTFGSADFVYSLLGEAGDKLSSATVSDVMAKMDDAKNQQSNGPSPLETIKDVLSKTNQGQDSQSQQKLQKAEEIRKGTIDLNPDQVASEELQKQLWQVLTIRDDVMKSIEGVIDTIPGLSELMDTLVNAITVYILTTIEPFVKPVMTSAIEGLQQGSAAVIDRQDQWEVFNDSNASDPTHSVISKDHFDLVLNEPGGQLAQLIVKHIVPLVVDAWFNDEDPNRVIDRALEVLHHPYWARDDSQIQRQMMDHLRSWIEGKPSNEKDDIIQSLTKDSIRQGRNKRKGAESYGTPGHSHGSGGGGGGGAYSIGAGQKWSGGGGGGRPQQHQHQQSGGYGSQQSGGYGSQQSGGYGSQQSGGCGSQQSGGYGSQQSGGYGSQQSGGGGYGQSQSTYGRKNDDDDDNRRTGGYGQSQSSYGRKNDDDDDNRRTGGYGQSQSSYGRKNEDDDDNRRTGGYGQSQSSYGRKNDDDDNENRRTGYGQSQSSYGRQDDDNERRSGGGGYGQSSYGRSNDDDNENRRTGYGQSQSSYGRSNDDDNERRSGGGGGYGQSQSSYGRRNDDDDNERRGGGGGYGQSSYGRSNDDDNERRGGGGYGQSQSSYGRRNDNDDDNERRGGGGGYGQSSYGRSNDDDNERQGGGYGQSSYGRSNDDDTSESFSQMSLGSEGRRRRNDDDDNSGGWGGNSGYGRD